MWLGEFSEFQDTNCRKSLRYSRRTTASGNSWNFVRHICLKVHFFVGICGRLSVFTYFSQSVEELGDVELNKGYFHQGGATYNQSRESMAVIQGFIEDRFISTDLWPLRLPDVRLTDFLWGCLKKRVFQNETSIIGALKKKHYK